MSCLRCDGCSRIIDTDDDVEAYIEKLDQWLCLSCRDDAGIDNDKLIALEDEARAALAAAREKETGK